MTSTSTETAVALAETFYAVCAADNMVSTIDGSTDLFSDGSDTSYRVLGSNPTTGNAYDCCVGCLLNPYCGVAQYYSFPGGAFCNFFSNTGTCSGATVRGAIVKSTSLAGGISTFMNTNCGRWNPDFPPA